jgi:hypothetical protein
MVSIIPHPFLLFCCGEESIPPRAQSELRELARSWSWYSRRRRGRRASGGGDGGSDSRAYAGHISNNTEYKVRRLKRRHLDQDLS